eukprot:c20208_g2_i1 orf=320-1972(-)
MASVVPHCSCNPASENHLVCHSVSLSSCFSRRHSLSSSEFSGFSAAASINKLKAQNAVLVVRAEASIAVETQTPISDAGTSADAVMAVSLAREAVQAANYVFALSNMHEYESDFVSEADLLRLQRARLAEMELNLFEVDEEKTDEVNDAEEGTSSALYVNDSCSPEGVKNLEDQKYKRKGESVSVRSTKRKERLTKRERANVKARKTVVSNTIGVDPLNRSSRQPRIPVQRAMADPIRSFLVNNGSGKARLLTAAEEVNLSHKIQDLLVLESTKRELQKQLGRDPTLAEWAKAMHMSLGAFSTRLTEGRRCKDTMIKCNLRLVISVAKKYEGKGMSVQDLIQEGSQGLIRGCEKFDPTKGFKFSTYAHWWIMQAVTRALLQKSRLVRVPSHVSDTLLRVRRAKEILKLKYGVSPSDADVARFVGITMERLRVVSNTSRVCKSMDKPVGRELNMNLGEMIADTSINPSECKFMKQLLKEDVDVVLRTLKPRERDVMKLRYGLDDGRRRTLEEIGRMFHVTRERIRQIECRAMIKLKDPERSEALRGLLTEC